MDASQGGLEGYDRLFYGVLDVLAGRGGPHGARELVDRLFQLEMRSDAKGGFLLAVAEQLVHELDIKSISIALDMCQK